MHRAVRTGVADADSVWQTTVVPASRGKAYVTACHRSRSSVLMSAVLNRIEDRISTWNIIYDTRVQYSGPPLNASCLNSYRMLCRLAMRQSTWAILQPASQRFLSSCMLCRLAIRQNTRAIFQSASQRFLPQLLLHALQIGNAAEHMAPPYDSPTAAAAAQHQSTGGPHVHKSKQSDIEMGGISMSADAGSAAHSARCESLGGHGEPQSTEADRNAAVEQS